MQQQTDKTYVKLPRQSAVEKTNNFSGRVSRKTVEIRQKVWENKLK